MKGFGLEYRNNYISGTTFLTGKKTCREMGDAHSGDRIAQIMEVYQVGTIGFWKGIQENHT